MTIQSSPSAAPNYSLHRENVSAADDMASITKKHGCNASMFEWIHVQVIPESGVEADVGVWFWCERIGAFVNQSGPIQVGSAGPGIPYEFSVEIRGRIFFVQILSTDGFVNVAVSGYNNQL
jgi:hypothetical protein